jgi:hypothetical protein
MVGETGDRGQGDRGQGQVDRGENRAGHCSLRSGIRAECWPGVCHPVPDSISQ